MKPISVWNPKGGQGKSMISINLAAAAVELGLRNPLVICQDPQGTSTLFHRAGNLPFEVISSIPKAKPDSDLVIIDHQASDWDLPPFPTVLMPVKPERSQYATYIDAYKRVEKVGKKIITVVTDGNMSRAAEKRTVLALRQRGAYEIRSSGVFAKAADNYLTIFHPSLNGEYKVDERRREFEAVLAAVLGNVSEKPLLLDEVEHGTEEVA